MTVPTGALCVRICPIWFNSLINLTWHVLVFQTLHYCLDTNNSLFFPFRMFVPFNMMFFFCSHHPSPSLIPSPCPPEEVTVEWLTCSKCGFVVEWVLSQTFPNFRRLKPKPHVNRYCHKPTNSYTHGMGLWNLYLRGWNKLKRFK